MDFKRALNYKNWSNPFSSKKDIETKSACDSAPIRNTSLIELLSFCGDIGLEDISAKALWSHYKRNNALRHSLDGLISPSFANIEPVIQDTETGLFLDDKESAKLGFEPLLQLLNKPNYDVTGNEFRRKMPPTYEVIGDVYIKVTAINEDATPREMFYIPPQSVSPLKQANGEIQSYSVNSMKHLADFHRKEFDDGRVSYFTKDGRWELWHIKAFNPEVDADSGLSPISSLIIEMEESYMGNTNNKNFLANGARPSGVLMMPADVDLSDEQEIMLKDRLRNYKGTKSGDVLIVQGGQNFHEMSTNNKDMDYLNMLERNDTQVYLRLNIPLPLVKNTAMTMNNYAESKYMLYDLKIIPFSEMFYSEMTEMLMRRFDDSGRYRIWFNEDDISALQLRRDERNKIKMESGVLTTDEKREIIGYQEYEGGDGSVIYQPSTLIAAGSSLVPTEIKSRDKFKKALEGMDKYTQEEIESKVKQAYG